MQLILSPFPIAIFSVHFLHMKLKWSKSLSICREEVVPDVQVVSYLGKSKIPLGKVLSFLGLSHVGWGVNGIPWSTFVNYLNLLKKEVSSPNLWLDFYLHTDSFSFTCGLKKSFINIYMQMVCVIHFFTVLFFDIYWDWTKMRKSSNISEIRLVINFWSMAVTPFGCTLVNLV